MSNTYRNTGARFPREDGESWVERGDEFEPTPRELAQRLYKLRRVYRPGDEGVAAEVGGEAAPAEGDEAPQRPSLLEDLTPLEFSKLHHLRAIDIVQGLEEGDPRLDTFYEAEEARSRGPRESVVQAFAARGVGVATPEEGADAQDG